ncbi:amidase family protein [Paraburkholderia sediminicola]|uniref:amidase family protein n=1 Tax=Paraburkholderia sediminicola TaxID=458836 RepID=UPI0038B8AFB0
MRRSDTECRWCRVASSANTAVAVTSAMAAFGLAKETGGSIQNPASSQDLVGIKPRSNSYGSRAWCRFPEIATLSAPIARTVRAAALCLDVLASGFVLSPVASRKVQRRSTVSRIVTLRRTPCIIVDDWAYISATASVRAVPLDISAGCAARYQPEEASSPASVRVCVTGEIRGGTGSQEDAPVRCAEPTFTGSS